MRLADLAAQAKAAVAKIIGGRGAARYYPPPVPPQVPRTETRLPAYPPRLPAVPRSFPGFTPPPLPAYPPPLPGAVLPPQSPLPATPSLPAANDILAEIQRLAQQMSMGQGNARDNLRRLASLLQRARSAGGLSPEQSQIVDAVSAMLDRWAALPEIRLEQEEAPRQRDEWPESDVRLLGRADVQQWPREYREFRTEQEMRRTPGSSNVYSFTWLEDEPRIGFGQKQTKVRRPQPTDNGTLIVTFKDWAPGSDERPDKPGATYAYSNVPRVKWEQFVASTSPNTAGVAVWDYLRVRGTISGHQHTYRLLSVSGEYIPRKATARGFQTRYLPGGVDEQVAWRKSTLAAGPLTRFGQEVASEIPLSPSDWRRRLPSVNPGAPNRGTPNRGR